MVPASMFTSQLTDNFPFEHPRGRTNLQLIVGNWADRLFVLHITWVSFEPQTFLDTFISHMDKVFLGNMFGNLEAW